MEKDGRKVRYQVDMMRMVDGWNGIDMYMVGIFIIFSRYVFNFF